MLGEAIKKRLEHRPFEPFRLLISSGEEVEVRHPEMAILTRSSIAVGHNMKDRVADYVLDYSLIHVVKIEPLGMPKSGNGRRRK